MSSRPAAVTACATACANWSLGTVPLAAGMSGSVGVVLDRHRLQAEAGRTTGQRDPRAVERQVDRLGRQAAADVGQQPAADQGPALVGDLGGQGGAGRGLVVERREHQALVAGVDEQAGEDGSTGADGQAARRPRDGVGERVAIHAELHTRSFEVRVGKAVLRQHQAVWASCHAAPTVGSGARHPRATADEFIPRSGPDRRSPGMTDVWRL